MDFEPNPKNIMDCCDLNDLKIQKIVFTRKTKDTFNADLMIKDKVVATFKHDVHLDIGNTLTLSNLDGVSIFILS